MTRAPRLLLAAAALGGCMLIGVVAGAMLSSGGEGAAIPVSNRPATSQAPTTTGVSVPASPTTVATIVPPTTAPPTTVATSAPPTTAPGPVADFSWSPEQPRPGESIRLLDHSSGAPVSYTWRWSGSVIRSSRAGNIAFNVRENTDITLEVCDREGRCNQATKTIVVG